MLAINLGEDSSAIVDVEKEDKRNQCFMSLHCVTSDKQER